jgi:multicomponent Na+:H+ antiporter subunit D
MIPSTIDLLLRPIPWAAFAVVIPLALALIAVPLGARARHLAAPGAAAGFLVAAMAAAHVVLHGAIDHNAGGWTAPLGIRLQLDGLSAAFLLMSAIVTGAVAWFARAEFGAGSNGEARTEFAFWPLLFAMWAGLNAIFVGSDLFNLYVALELLTLTAVAMVALNGKAANLAAAMRYLLFAFLGSLAYLLGAVLLYAAYGTLDMQLLKESAKPDRVSIAAGALMTAGLMAKTAIFPLHAWLPPAHAGAPAPASAMLSALVVKASFYLIARLWFDALPAVATAESAQLFGALGAGGILFGSLLALRQQRLKLVVAYSTVAQLGYLFLVFPLAGGAGAAQPWAATAWSGGMFHAIAHALAKGSMFLAAGLMMRAVGHDRLSGLAGIGRDLPMATFAFGLAAVSLMGLPPSGGFIAKYLMLTSALASGQWWWVVAIVGGGLLAAAYLFRAMNYFLGEPDRKEPRAIVRRRDQWIALALACGAILLGIFSNGLYDLLQIGRAVAASEGLQ